jgi:hypothetical protein
MLQGIDTQSAPLLFHPLVNLLVEILKRSRLELFTPTCCTVVCSPESDKVRTCHVRTLCAITLLKKKP